MATQRAFQRLELARSARLQAALESVGVRLQPESRVARPVGAAGVAREGHHPAGFVELDDEIVAPMLAKLLEVAAGVLGRHADLGGGGHYRSFDAYSRSIRCAASSMIAATAWMVSLFTASRSSLLTRTVL